MKAIETVYKGYKFRSRLEARWAVFFDSLGIKYEYEAQGYECEIGSNEHLFRYLPDFYLVDQNIFVEVKGPESGFKDMFDGGFGRFLDYGCPLPRFTNSGANPGTFVSGGLLCLGGIPDATYGIPFHPLLRHSSGLGMRPAFFAADRVFVVPEEIGLLMGLGEMYGDWSEDDAPHIPINWDTIRLQKCYTSARDAYIKARQARFEHGDLVNISSYGSKYN